MKGDERPRRAMEMRARYLVLLLLAEGPKTGYEIVKRMREILRDVGSGVSPGTLYPLLRSLEEEGLVSSTEEPRGQRRRKVYRITRLGAEKLLEMMVRGLELLEASLSLHIEAMQRLLDAYSGPRIAALAEEFASRLERLEELSKRLRAVLSTAARGEAVAEAGPATGA